MRERTPTTTDTPAREEIPPINGFDNPPTDPDNEGLYEDINGDNTFDIADVQALFAHYDGEVVQNHQSAFDFNDDGTVDVVDVQALFVELQQDIPNDTKRKLFEIFGAAIRDIGEQFRSIDTIDRENLQRFTAAQTRLEQAATELDDLDEADRVLRETIAAFDEMGHLLGTFAEAVFVEPRTAAHKLELFADFIATLVTIPDEFDPGFVDAADRVREAATLARAAFDPVIHDQFEDMVANMQNQSPDELAANADELLAIEDENFRKVFELDDPKVQTGLEMAATDPVGAQEIAATLSGPALQTAATHGFTTNINAVGATLVRAGNLIVDMPLGLLGTSWSDDCPSVCEKQNCQLDKNKIQTTRCGNDPGDWETAQKAMDYLGDVQPNQHADDIGKAAKNIFKMTTHFAIYLQCEYEHCEDTPCWPWGGVDLEWESGCDNCSEPIQIPSETNTCGGINCWCPLGQPTQAKKRALARGIQEAEQECQNKCS